jgi:hypothetical protein
VIVTPQEANALAVHLAKNLGYDVSNGLPIEILSDQKFMDKLHDYFKRLIQKRQPDGKSEVLPVL